MTTPHQDGLPHALTDLDLGPLVAGCGPDSPNHGFSLRHGDESTPAPGVVYHSSRAADPADRPSLVLEYVPPTAPGAVEQVKAVAADGGLLATWNPPTDPGAAIDTLHYTVVVTKDSTEVARTTTEDTRAAFPGLANGADHQATVTTGSPYGTGTTAASAAVTVAPPAQDHVDEGGSDPEDKPLITLEGDGMLPEEPLPHAPPAVLRAAPGSGTANWAKRNVTIRWEYGQDCTKLRLQGPVLRRKDEAAQRRSAGRFEVVAAQGLPTRCPPGDLQLELGGGQQPAQPPQGPPRRPGDLPATTHAPAISCSSSTRATGHGTTRRSS
ncbi:fibronectin type III domain-containing protein [Streptomyces sp. NBC_00237]|uniref:fibronectin type III domain-containing protein n=1 Tax=Streptomyces sp. NBC_00237 TaxID=2975687 RepID=UPI00224D9F32|nr:fibronectin type III domain-containing protein [Streptomyces sp. NBC_00237]MCX5205669.1 fibronectin type III domain-containing protein [Streptomyces sp. NBC_00237]